MNRALLPFAAFLLLVLAAAAPETQQPQLRNDDRIRLAEAFHLADSVRDKIWDGWSAVPFVILLVTPEHEFLLRHPYPPEDFSPIGYDEQLETDIYVRSNSGRFSPNFLATFPAIRGINTVVIGQPENTGRNSTSWVIVALHEHFHQLQYTRPWYYDGVAALDLAGGDDSGLWQLNYPFPYEDSRVGQAFLEYKTSLEALLGEYGDRSDAGFHEYLQARAALRERLSDADYRYMSFQLWQEGVARYTEYAVAQAASDEYEPLPGFEALADFVPYAVAARSLHVRHAEEMATLDLASWRRIVFYPVGASEALLLDARNPDWKTRYFTEPFYIERYFSEK